jgi:hypothetical protein
MKAPTPAATPAQRIEELRARIRNLSAELDRTQRLVVPLEAALSRARAAIDAAQQGVMLELGQLVAPGGGPRLDLGQQLRERPTGVLALLCGDALTAVIEQRLRRFYEAGPGIDAATRQQRVAELEAEIEAAEIAEERLIRAAEERGEEIDRRGDAPPGLVLAATLEGD